MSVMEERSTAARAPRADWSSPLDAEGAARIERFAAAMEANAEVRDREALESHARWLDENPGRTTPTPLPSSRLLASEVQVLKDAVGQWPLPAGLAEAMGARSARHYGAPGHLREAFLAYAAEPGVSVVDVVRLHEILLQPREEYVPTFPKLLGDAFDILLARGTVRSLFDVAPACEDVGLGAGLILRDLIKDGEWASFARAWPDDIVLPYMAAESAVLAALVFRTSEELFVQRTAVITLMYRLPVFDATLQAAADELCFASQPIVREHSQDLRATRPGALALAMAGLAHEKPERRLIAARWLGRLGDAVAIDPLHAALARETLGLQRGGMLDALVALGASIDRYIDRDVLAADARRGLARGVPKDIAFFRFNLLPVVRWADSGDDVPADALRWLMVQALKRKKVEPDAILRRFCAQFEPAGRAAFARFIMEGWIAEDTRTPGHDVALAAADGVVARHRAAHPSTSSDYLATMHRRVYAGRLRALPDHTAASKGLFALVGACADGSIAVPLARYMKRYHRPRKTMMPHLLSVLAQVAEAPTLQLLLSIGTQTGAPRVQAKATELAGALAERQGWTVEELADRSVPTVGFDDDGRQELSYGPRHVIAELKADLGIVLRDSAGKVLKSMPAKRVDDDEELVKEAKGTLKVTREMIAQVATLQPARWRASGWMRRDWSLIEWDTLIHRHVVLRHLARRVVWQATSDAGETVAFRPLGDGTLTGIDDDAITIHASARVKVASDESLGPDESARWIAHLADYDIAPAWPQLGQPLHAPTPDQRDPFVIEDFAGHMIGSWALRKRMGTLGYRRLANFGHDTSAIFHKLLAGTDLIVQVRATDHGFDEGDVDVALVSMTVFRHDGRGNPGRAMDVHAMPAALYSFCLEEFRTLAADGSGFRDDWRQATWMDRP